MTLLSEIRQSLRSLLRQPGFLFTAVLTLALGVGAVTAVSSVVYGVLLKPLPYPQAERIVEVLRVQENYGGPVSRPLYFDWREATRGQFEALAATSGGISTLRVGDAAERRTSYRVSPEFWTVLGLSPLLGRWFGQAEEDSGEKVVVLSHALWQQRFAGRSDVIGERVELNGEAWTVIGVAPEALRLPEGAELYLPTHLPLSGAERGTSYLRLLGRYAEGVTPVQAQAALDAVNARLAEAYPSEHAKLDTRLQPLRDGLGAHLQDPLWSLFVASLLVLLIACANLANLLLARATQRSAEYAVRAALGAARGRLLRAALVEALLIGVLGALGGALIAAAGVPLLLAGAPDLLPAQVEVSVDLRVLSASLALSLGTLLLFALLPARRAASVAPAGSLGEAGRGPAAARHGGRARRLLVVAEVALALTLLAGAGLMIESLRRLGDVDTGVQAEGVLTASLVLSVPPGPDGEGWEDTYRRHTQFIAPKLDAVLAAVKGLPGVEAVGLSDSLPLSALDNFSSSVRVIGSAPVEGQEPGANWRFVNPDFFAAVGLMIEQGRGLQDSDARAGEMPGNVLVNRSFARRFMGEGNPVGRQIEFLGGPKTVVGVVADTRHFGADREPPPEVYMHHHQAVQEQFFLALRVRGEPMALAEPLRRALQTLDPAMPVSAIRPFAALAEDLNQLRVFRLRLMTIFSAVALSLAAIGLYGVISYGVQQRRQELGIRMSLGADARRLLGLLLRQGLGLLLIGLALGVVGALLLGRSLSAQLFGVDAFEPVVLLVVACVLGATGVAACLIPSLRAVRADPVQSLRGA
ncbi:ABC transporter permease [Aquimonas voraii]|uniref:Duplicated orphan permease n=1 Tax=Aquimonas voraii TaxID=265719 RepID=A0A1G6VZZ9_9GAMM|nr:ABC transporter permease [Aquimonas voraii]SDD59013.1 duplicated orphan permease [Aquimonas voraii]